MAEEGVQRMLQSLRWGRFAIWLIAGIVLMVTTLFAWHSTEEFLIKDDRFRVSDGDESTGQSPNLILEGVHYASASQIRNVFKEDFGRSLYLVPIQERREQLLAIDWIQTASVSKIWPKTLRVRVQERVPVAFLHLRPATRGGISRFVLIDSEGFILRPKVAAKFTLPVLTGIGETESIENRRARVRRVLEMLKEIGPLGKDVSEVDVTDPNNLIVSEHVDGTVVKLMLGDENYAERMQNFLTNYGEIRAKRPDATTLDLRVDGVITATGEGRRGE
ncbi:MAG: cell division protein FtsQ/DivIB [Bryobacteraceae bacterium]